MAKADKASVGFALIARDAEKTLEPCLRSISPYVRQIVVAVDELTKDKTANVARRFGAKVVPVQVSDWHECPSHGRILAQDFAKARNVSFSHLDPDLDWHAWIDADDVLEGAQYLPQLLKSKIPPEFIGFWSPYHYAYVVKEDGSRQVNTLFHRERIFRTRVQGQQQKLNWQYRVHEVCVAGIQGPFIQLNNVIWVHQHQQHKAESSAPRNLRLLEIDLEEDPGCGRTIFYIGNQYFAVGDWLNAANWYEEYTRLPKEKHNPYELWQSYIYMSMAYERLQDIQAAFMAAWGAMDTIPQHPEPYYRLAQLYALAGDPEKSIYWKRQGDTKEEAPFFVFKNPMDRAFNSNMPYADSLLELGDVTGAKTALREAVQSFPDDKVIEKLKYVENKERAMKAAQSYVELVPAMTEDQALAVYANLPDTVKQFGRTRNIAMNALKVRRKGKSQPHIIFWCAAGWEPWAPPSLNGSGIGGSETAVIEIAKRFAKAGWLVDVYNGCDYMEGVYDDVGYWDLNRLSPDDYADVLVGWRQPAAHELPIVAKRKILWMHDLNGGPDIEEQLKGWHWILGVSQWHADMLQKYYGFYASYVNNGINLERFDGKVKKVPFQCVYASSPDRGLLRLLDLWPQIVKAEPAARLHIAYGWDTAMKMVERGRPGAEALLQLKEVIEKRCEALGDSVIQRGRLPQDELAKLYSESYLWTYPTDFLEVSCISAMEAMAGGAVPVTTKCGALPETIAGAGLMVPAPSFSRGYGESWARTALGLMTSPAQRKLYEARGRGRAKELTWDASFQRWLSIVEEEIDHNADAQDNQAKDDDSGNQHPESVAA